MRAFKVNGGRLARPDFEEQPAGLVQRERQDQAECRDYRVIRVDQA